VTHLVRRLGSLLALLGTLASLGCSGAEADRASGEQIRGLVPGDVILVTDQTGSLLGEFDERGNRLTTVSLAPYGFARQDDSHETQKHAGAPRDAAVDLDHMGARFYAPDLGQWTSADPIALSDPNRLVTAEFGAAHPYAYANHRPVIAADRGGQFWHVAVGALIGASWAAGAEGFSQYLEHGRIVDPGRIGAAAAGGAVTGVLTALNPAAGLVRMAAADVAGGLVERGIASGGRDVGTFGDAAADALGSVGGKSLEALGSAAKKAAGSSKRFSKEKQALVDMAQADKKTGITKADMEAYIELNNGLPDPFPKNTVTPPERHPLRSADSKPGPGQEWHGHVGPVHHIPIKGMPP